jgi:hypothetical protein
MDTLSIAIFLLGRRRVAGREKGRGLTGAEELCETIRVCEGALIGFIA